MLAASMAQDGEPPGKAKSVLPPLASDEAFAETVEPERRPITPRSPPPVTMASDETVAAPSTDRGAGLGGGELPPLPEVSSAFYTMDREIARGGKAASSPPRIAGSGAASRSRS